MGSKPMFFFAGVYDDRARAEADYGAIKSLHDSGEVGSYDAAVITKDAGGKVKVSKTEKPTQHGGWVGLAGGAAVAVAFPVALPAVVTAGGAGVGAWIAHLAHGTSRKDAKEIGALLSEGDAALVVVGIDKDAGAIENAAVSSKRHVLKQLPEADWDEAEQEAVEAMSLSLG